MNTPNPPDFASQGSSNLRNDTYTPLPLGSILPQGWLLGQLRIQADGLSGHLDEFWPSVAQSGWIGGDSDGWERGPYWLDGLVPLAILLDDDKLIKKATKWLDYIISHQDEEGWLGPRGSAAIGSGRTDLDPWPIFVVLKAMTQWQEATGDTRIVPSMQRALRRIDTLLDEHPLTEWAAMRWQDLAVSLKWLYVRTGEEWLLDLWRKVEAQGYDWPTHFAGFKYTEKQPEWKLENHVVNHAMALKEPATRISSDADGAEMAKRWMAILDEFHGQASGVFSGDESLAGRNPTQGTELCSVVEYMYSLEVLISTFGDAIFGDRLEQIAYNALPATFTPNMWAHQYDQQANQVLVTDAPRPWTNNDNTANLFGLEPHFGCCTANMHQGWPKLAASLWMQTEDGGLAAIAYAPCTVNTTCGGHHVSLTEETDYPFRDTIKITLKTDGPVQFSLSLRIPAWAKTATVQIGDEPAVSAAASQFHRIDRIWTTGDTIVLSLPATIELETRYQGAVTVKRGPLVFALKIEEEFTHLRGELPHADWEVRPKSPWNYGLAISGDSTEEQIEVSTAEVGDTPFGAENPPITLTVPARLIPGWGLENNVAAEIPGGENASETLEYVTLAPYGCTHLRITEFPRV